MVVGERLLNRVPKLVYTEAATSQVVNTAWALLTLMAADFGDKKIMKPVSDVLLNRQTDIGDWPQETFPEFLIITV